MILISRTRPNHHMSETTSIPASHDHALEAIRQQLCILVSHTSCELGWSPSFVRQHAQMIFQLADAYVRIEEERKFRLTGND